VPSIDSLHDGLYIWCRASQESSPRSMSYLIAQEIRTTKHYQKAQLMEAFVTLLNAEPFGHVRTKSDRQAQPANMAQSSYWPKQDSFKFTKEPSTPAAFK